MNLREFLSPEEINFLLTAQSPAAGGGDALLVGFARGFFEALAASLTELLGEETRFSFLAAGKMSEKAELPAPPFIFARVSFTEGAVPSFFLALPCAPFEEALGVDLGEEQGAGELARGALREAVRHAAKEASAPYFQEPQEVWLEKKEAPLDSLKKVLAVTFQLIAGEKEKGKAALFFPLAVSAAKEEASESKSEKTEIAEDRGGEELLNLKEELLKKKEELIARFPQLRFLLDVPLKVTVVLGETKRSLGEVRALVPGKVIEFEKKADEAVPVEVLLNGVPVAEGELVVVNGDYGVRITSILSLEERISRLKE